MALHRDIFWIGRQWAVTGHGMQAIDQRLNGEFDIDISRLWDDELSERMQAHAWLNIADFDKGLALARARYPEPAGRAAPPPKAVLPKVAPIEESISRLPDSVPIEPPKPALQTFELRAESWPAKLVRPWRVRR